AVAAPFCTSRLADAGATVFKVERPEGDFARGYDAAAKGQSSYFVWLNRGKESIALDLKSGADLSLMRRLIAQADVFVQNLAPGAVARLGLGVEDLREANPRLIAVSISGYGDEASYRDRKAYDLLVQAETGLASITGTPDAPGRVGVSACDIACGMTAHAAVLEALIARGVSGQGRTLDVSLFDAVADWMTVPLLQYEASGRSPGRVGLNHPSIAPYGIYRCADGELLIAVQNEREWRALCQMLSRPDLTADARFATNIQRVAHRGALDAELSAALAGLSLGEAATALGAAGIAFARLNDVAGLAAHPVLRRVAVETEGGPVRIVAPPVVVRGVEAALGPAPALNQHGRALRAEFAETA
ncbi:MAG: CoA transferase, partial [Phenylobacterium sp.]|nr:CoA transferase [Phenylobacterium sp.]